MNLEDHLGDIIGKGRLISNVPAATAARAAEITADELVALEDSGQCSGKPNFAALAKTVGLNPSKLASIAAGWLPKANDLSLWRGLRGFTSAGDGMTVNCYLVWDEGTRDAALFDTGFDARPVCDTIAAEQLQLRHLFITHTHHDHIAALGTIRAAFPQARMHSSSRNAPVNQRNQPGESIPVGGLQVSYRETPGHAADGVTYLISNWPDHAPQVAIVGDAIFAGSMGRGNDGWELARQKVREHILSLSPDTLLCPGHGPLTTVAEEQAHNPFF